MSPGMSIARAKTWGRSLEEREMRRAGVDQDLAREAVARRVGCAPGTLENLRNGRLKTIASHVYAGLRAAVISEMEAEIARLSHEVHLARQAGLDAHDVDFAATEAALERARALIRPGE